MPAERSFSLVERRMKAFDTIIMPNEYDNCISPVGNLHILGEDDVHIRNYKAVAQQYLKFFLRTLFPLSICKLRCPSDKLTVSLCYKYFSKNLDIIQCIILSKIFRII